MLWSWGQGQPLTIRSPKISRASVVLPLPLALVVDQVQGVATGAGEQLVKFLLIRPGHRRQGIKGSEQDVGLLFGQVGHEHGERLLPVLLGPHVAVDQHQAAVGQLAHQLGASEAEFRHKAAVCGTLGLRVDAPIFGIGHEFRRLDAAKVLDAVAEWRWAGFSRHVGLLVLDHMLSLYLPTKPAPPASARRGMHCHCCFPSAVVPEPSRRLHAKGVESAQRSVACS